MSTTYAYSAEFLASLDRIISNERLARYLTATRGNTQAALRLYERNMNLSEALFGYLHGLEVAVRNSIHVTLRAAFGTPTWFDYRGALPWSSTGEHLLFTSPMQDMIAHAKASAGAGAQPGKILAELMFGFWPNLLTGRYHASLWVPCLHRAFPYANEPRRVIHLRLEQIRRLRNRIAHHEPVLTSANQVYTGFAANPFLSLPEIWRCVEWVSPDAALWLAAKTHYQEAVELLLEVSRGGVTL